MDEALPAGILESNHLSSLVSLVQTCVFSYPYTEQAFLDLIRSEAGKGDSTPLGNLQVMDRLIDRSWISKVFQNVRKPPKFTEKYLKHKDYKFGKNVCQNAVAMATSSSRHNNLSY